MQPFLSIREMAPADITLIANYWDSAAPSYLKAMGVDVAKRPQKIELVTGLHYQLSLPVPERRAYCLVLEIDGVPAGHCNTNPTFFGVEAFMHLHIWQTASRQNGFGAKMISLCVPRFFQTLQLQRLICEPYALNEAPNKTLPKAGFQLVKEYVTTPGYIAFEQPVKRWEMTRDRFQTVYGGNESSM